MFAESIDLRPRMFGVRWRSFEMMNNEEQLDPFPVDPATEAVLAARASRRPTALDEGRAWRGTKPGGLAVLRVELFADADATAHREAWQTTGPACLEATWRVRWQERDRQPGWIEARRQPEDAWTEDLAGSALAASGTGDEQMALRSACDWLRVEDHTDPTGSGSVTVYEHLTVWRDRAQITLTLRHDIVDEFEDSVVRAGAALYRALGDAPMSAGGD